MGHPGDTSNLQSNANVDGVAAHISTYLSEVRVAFDRLVSATVEVGEAILHWKYTPATFLTLVAIVTLVVLQRKYSKWHRNWLSYLTEKRIRAVVKEEDVKRNRADLSFLKPTRWFKWLSVTALFKLLNWIRRYFGVTARYDIKHLYFPSPTSFLILFLLVGIFFIDSHLSTAFGELLTVKWWSAFFGRELTPQEHSNVVMILTGEVAVIFSLVIFVAESIRSRRSEDEKRVLLKISHLWLLASGATLSLIGFLWGSPNSVSLIFPLALGATIIASFWKVIIHLVVPSVQEENRIKFLKERVQRSFDASIRERVGNNILLEHVGANKRIKLELTLSREWVKDKTAQYVEIGLPRSGWLSDINLVELELLVQLLTEEARRLGFDLYPKPEQQATASQRGQNVQI